MAKKAVTRGVGSKSDDPEIAALEAEMLEKVNALGVGAAGGRRHQHGARGEHPHLPDAHHGAAGGVNIQCHSARLKEATLSDGRESSDRQAVSQRDTSTAQTPGMHRAEGCGAKTVGAEHLWVGHVHVDEGVRSGPHHHGELESAIYVISGHARFRYGDKLEHIVEAEPGDFVFVPPYLVHQEINASDDERGRHDRLAQLAGEHRRQRRPACRNAERANAWQSRRINDLEVRLTTPVTEEDVVQLKIGDHVRVTGVIYTARDAAHNRMIETLERGRRAADRHQGPADLLHRPDAGPARPRRRRLRPHDLDAHGPLHAPPARRPGSRPAWARATAARRCSEALKQYHAVYLMAVGGAGAMLSQFVKKVEVIAYEDLGTESLKRVEVEDFPAVVMDDCEGRDLLNEGRKQWRDMSKLGNYKPSERIVVAGG